MFMKIKYLFVSLVLCLSACTTVAMVPAQVGPVAASGAGGAATCLDGAISSLVFELDATNEDSYDGSSQTWSNLTASPATGDSQTDYDFCLGSDCTVATNDPTFTGSAGDSGAYFAMDGTDFFRLKSGNTSFLNGLHKTTGGTPWWIVIKFRYAGSGFNGTWGNVSASSSEGIRPLTSNTAATRVNVDRGGSRTNNNFATGNFVVDTDYVMIVSGDPSDTDDLTVWVDSSTGITDTDASAITSTADAAETFEIGAGGGGNFSMDNGQRVYAVAGGNEFIDDTKAGNILGCY